MRVHFMVYLLCVVSLSAGAETFYKCIDPAGHVIYQDTPCVPPTVGAEEFYFSGEENRQPLYPPPPQPNMPPPVNIYNNNYYAPPPPAYPAAPGAEDFAAVAARKYAQEQAARELRNCRIMGTCPTAMERMQRQKMYLQPDAGPASSLAEARERAEQALRNCRIMKTCPTPLDRVVILQRYGLATQLDVSQCARYRDAVYCLGR